MDILVKMYSSNWETYKKHYKKAAILALAKDGYKVSASDIRHELIEIPGDTVQKQRHGSTEHSRTMRVYVDGRIKYVIGLSNTNFDEDKRLEAEAAKKRLENSSPLKGDYRTEKSRAKYVYGYPNYHANTYLNQGINKIMDTYFRERKKNPGVKLFFYLLDTTQSYCSNLSNIMNYRKLATVGLDILNIDQVDKNGWKAINFEYKEGKSIAYSSFNKFLNDITQVSSRNTGNVPSYVKCIEEEVETDDGKMIPLVTKYIYTFKGLGAEAYDCFLIMWTLIVLAKKEKKVLEFLFAPEKYNFRIGQEHPRFTQDIPETITKLFEQLEIDVEYESTDEVLQQLEREKSQYEQAKSKGELRNQTMFRNALRAKGLQTKCYLCGCDVESILEAAHLWGVAEIRNATDQRINKAINEPGMEGIIDADSIYSKEIFYKRYMLANSGHNGVWLCSNHHGMFDSHHFIFNSEDGKLIITTPDSNAQAFLESTIKNKSLEKSILTPQTKTFLKHADVSNDI
mgnify:CR=1 FL=1